MRRRIAIDGRPISDRFPGIGRYVFNLVRELPEVAEDHFTVVLDRGAPQHRFALDSLERAGVELIYCDGDPRSARGWLGASRLGPRLSLSLLHATSPFLPAAPGCPVVLTMHDLIPLRVDGTMRPVMRWLYRILLHRALRAAAHVLAVSETTKDDLVALGVEAAHITVTPAAPDPHFRRTGPAAVEDLRLRLGLPDRYVLFLGGNRPHKNLTVLLEAWERVRRLGDESHGLVVAGNQDPRWESPSEHAGELGLEDVVFLGEVAEEDLPALFSGATLFVQPSLWEGVGLPLLEAMACGVPVACSAVAGLEETAGGAALGFDPRRPAEVAAVMAEALANPALREDLAARGRARVAPLSWRETARCTAAAYARVLA